MRTTIDLPDDLHRILTSLARHTGRSLGQTVAELVRRGLETPVATGVRDVAAVYRLHPRTGLPVVASRQPLTEDDVRALDDDDARDASAASPDAPA
ncbi:MAG: hypothetical protein KF800_03035 [Lysobacter sp.]|nr:hypothetical protein [Lysobacter sp.]